MFNSYRELTVWQKTIDLVQIIYNSTSRFFKEGAYNLSAQMRRAAIPIPSNITKAKRREDLLDFFQFLRITDASFAKLETQIIISKGYIPKSITHQPILH